MTEGTTTLAATRYRTGERLPPIVRAVLDARDEAAVIFGAHGEVLYLNRAAHTTLPPATITPSIDRDRKSGVEGKRVDLGGRRIIKKKKKEKDRRSETSYKK